MWGTGVTYPVSASFRGQPTEVVVDAEDPWSRRIPALRPDAGAAQNGLNVPPSRARSLSYRVGGVGRAYGRDTGRRRSRPPSGRRPRGIDGRQCNADLVVPQNARQRRSTVPLCAVPGVATPGA
jgi:hypothetical protein